jgi:sarcosine oxidase subunit gamma
MADASLRPLPRTTQVDLRADPADAALVDRLGEALGVALPIEPNTVAGDGPRRILWLGPDEWLVVDEQAAPTDVVAAIEGAAGDSFVTAVDLSSNRVVLALSGPGARDVLAGGCTIDLHARAFPPGRCAQTLLARAQVIIERAGDEDPAAFRLYVRPSFAPYAAGWLGDAIGAGSSGSPTR